MKIILTNIFLLLSILTISLKINAQANRDSLWRAYNNKSQSDTSRLKAIEGIASNYSDINLDTSVIMANKLLQLAEQTHQKKYEGKAYQIIGYSFFIKGKLPEALEYYTKSVIIFEKFGVKKEEVSSLIWIGTVYNGSGNHQKGLEYQIKALNKMEKLHDLKGLADCYDIIGNTYFNIGDFDKTISYWIKRLKICESLHDSTLIANTLSAIGQTYTEKQDYKQAIEYLSKALIIQERFNRNNDMYHALIGLGDIYTAINEKAKALNSYNKALQISSLMDDNVNIAYCYLKISGFYKKNNNTKEAIKYAEKSLEIANKSKDLYYIGNAVDELWRLNEKIGNYKEAFNNYKFVIKIRDSINNQESTRKFAEQELKIKDESFKAIQLKKELDHKDEQNKNEAELVRQRNVRNIILIGFLILFIFAVFVFINLQRNKKKNKTITQQKHLIEEKHKEITDSINYAERIQRSFLATKEQLDINLKNYFVLFQPKDIVSGDFYWAQILKNGNFALVTADSTGHGVPGAIMSLLNTSSLEKAVELGIYEPAEILNHTRKTIIERLKKDGSVEGGKDGMDCSLISLNTDKRKLVYSAANNPIWIVRALTDLAINQLIELKSDKIPVGKHDRDTISFTQHEVELQKGDMIYTLTDGFPDQFGGPKGKKFMYKKLKEMLISISNLPLNEQHEFLKNSLRDWMGNTDQVDDVTIIGIKI